MSDYANTVPSLLCQRWFDNCIQLSIAQDRSDIAIQEACQSVACGTRSALSASSGSGASGSASSTGGAGAASTRASSAASGAASTAASSASGAAASATGAAAALEIGKTYGAGILGAGILAAFGLAL